MSVRFNRSAFLLATLPGIERVGRIYQQYGQEIALIEFAGNERDLLAESQRYILGFFDNITSDSY